MQQADAVLGRIVTYTSVTGWCGELLYRDVLNNEERQQAADVPQCLLFRVPALSP